jgi:hypothetical protein
MAGKAKALLADPGPIRTDKPNLATEAQRHKESKASERCSLEMALASALCSFVSFVVKGLD